MDIIGQSERLYAYCEKHSTPEDESLQKLNRDTHLKTLAPNMLSGHLQGSFLTLISKMMQPSRILEIGTFTGYSAICLAKGLKHDGKLISIDVSKDYRYLAEKAIEESGMGDKIELITGDAKEIIPSLAEPLDIVFIDADKEAYLQYFRMVKPKMRPGGIIIADNVLWKGKVLDDDMDKKTRALHDFNEAVCNDSDVMNMVLPLRDGLNIIMVNE